MNPLVVKPRDIPIEMLQTEALNRRLANHHFKKKDIERKARNLRAGFNGEESLDFSLSFLKDDAYRILHSLRIPDDYDFFQIDNLISSLKFILINEVKNIAGTVMYDEFGQAIRILKNGEEENLGNHLEQVNLQHTRLLEWMRRYDFPAIPIEKLIVYSNPSTIIKNPSNNRAIANTVIYKEQLLTRLNEFAFKYKRSAFSDEQLAYFSSLLIDQHTPKRIDVLATFGVKRTDVMCGVFCPECGALPMKRINGNWMCSFCGKKSKRAHIPTLKDFSLIFGNKMSNRDAREFLMVDDIYVAQRLLKKEGFETEGSTRDRRYILSFLSY